MNALSRLGLPELPPSTDAPSSLSSLSTGQRDIHLALLHDAHFCALFTCALVFGLKGVFEGRGQQEAAAEGTFMHLLRLLGEAYDKVRGYAVFAAKAAVGWLVVKRVPFIL